IGIACPKALAVIAAAEEAGPDNLEMRIVDDTQQAARLSAVVAPIGRHAAIVREPEAIGENDAHLVDEFEIGIRCILDQHGLYAVAGFENVELAVSPVRIDRRVDIRTEIIRDFARNERMQNENMTVIDDVFDPVQIAVITDIAGLQTE